MKKNNLMKILLTITIISMLLLSACGQQVADQEDEELSDLDKEIKALQEELKQDQEEMQETESSEEMEEAKEETPDVPEDKPEEPRAPSSNMKTLTVMETEMVNLVLSSNDADEDKITYTFSAPVDKNGKWKTKYGDAGNYEITITASDGKLKTKQSILLIVEKKNEAPTIAPIADMSIVEGDKINIKPVVKDVNGDKIEVTFSAPLDEDGVWETDHTSSGSYEITITASDGEKQSTEKLKIRVQDKNMPPAIANVEDIVVDEGETVTINPQVTDLDGDDVDVTISEPVGNDGVWQTTYTDHGIYTITITARDGKGTSTHEIKVTVRDINRPPQILDITLG